MAFIDYRQIQQAAVSGWWKCCDPGTSCSIEIGGTSKSGANAVVYLTDLIVTSHTDVPISLYAFNGTSPGGTLYLINAELPGTSCVFHPPFNVYPRTGIGTNLYIHAASQSNGTVSLMAGGFIV